MLYFRKHFRKHIKSHANLKTVHSTELALLLIYIKSIVPYAPGVQQLSISPLMCQVAVVVVVVVVKLHPFDASACWHCPAMDSQQHKAREIESAEVVHGMVGGDEGWVHQS